MPTINRIRIDDVAAITSCHSHEWVEEKFGRRKRVTLLEILGNEDVSADDRIWVACKLGVIPDRELRLFACRTAARSLRAVEKAGETVPKNQWNVIRVARRFANGRASKEELKEAYWAANYAVNWAIYSAAYRVADRAANWAAYYAANRAANRAANWAANWAAYYAANRAADRAANWAAYYAANRAAYYAANWAAYYAANRAAYYAANWAADRAAERRTQLADLRRVVKKLGGK